MMRLTVIGSGPAEPQPDTPASGFLVEWSGGAVLLDCGTGVSGRLRGSKHPTELSALIVGHMHADHFLDLAPLRYMYAWPGQTEDQLPVFLPPGARPKLDSLARVISERATFFDDAFLVSEYDPSAELQLGDVTVRFLKSRHYVPAWGMELKDSSGTRLVYAGDTGPSDPLLEFAAGADLLILESTLSDPSEDDLERGHLTSTEAIEIARVTGARQAMLTHYATRRRPEITARVLSSGLPIHVAVPGLQVEVGVSEESAEIAEEPVA